MSTGDDLLFYKRATDAIVSTTLGITSVEPTIRELLRRIKQEPAWGSVQRSNEVEVEQHSVPTTVSTASLHVTPMLSDVYKAKQEETTMSPVISEKNAVNSGDSDRSVRVKSEGSSTKSHKVTKKTSTKPKDKSKSEEDTVYHYCSQCSLKFNRSSDLRRHERAHLLVLPYICTQCGKGFARKDALKRHSGTMTCKRNRRKLMEAAGREVSELINEAIKTGRSLWLVEKSKDTKNPQNRNQLFGS